MDASAEELAALVRRAQQRDPEAFVALIEALRPRLWARARAYAAGAAEAEDLLQETCLRAYEHLEDLKEPRAASAWMLTILDRLGRRSKPERREAPLEAAPEGEPADERAAGQAFLELAEGAEAAEDLRRALAELEPDDRELLALRFGADRNATQIAAELGLSPEAVRTRLCRIVARLRKRMGVRP